jgi:hypothetical protein
MFDKVMARKQQIMARLGSNICFAKDGSGL